MIDGLFCWRSSQLAGSGALVSVLYCIEDEGMRDVTCVQEKGQAARLASPFYRPGSWRMTSSATCVCLQLTFITPAIVRLDCERLKKTFGVHLARCGPCLELFPVSLCVYPSFVFGMAAFIVSGGVMSYFLSVIEDLVRVAGCSLGVIGNVGRDDAAAQPAGHENNFFLQAIGTVESRFPYFD